MIQRIGYFFILPSFIFFMTVFSLMLLTQVGLAYFHYLDQKGQEEFAAFEAATSDNNFRLEGTSFAKCRDNEGNLSDVYWGVVRLSNKNQIYWARGIVQIKLIDRDGMTVGSFGADRSIAAGSQTWIVNSAMLNRGQAISLKNRHFDHIELTYSSNIRDQSELIYLGADESFASRMRWIKQDGTETGYHWTTTVKSHTITSNDSHPRHTLEIVVSNTGTKTMFRTKVFAAIYNSNEQLVDLAWSEKIGEWPTGVSIKAAQDKTILLKSLSLSGRCLGEYDPKGYNVEYWVDTITITGQPLTTFHQTPLRLVD